MKYQNYSREELIRMEQASIPLTKRDLTGMIFGYAELNAGEAEFGVDYGGFSVILYDYGVVEVREYLFSQILAEERLYSVPQSCISEIQQQYQKYHDEIQTMYAPNNCSCDGSFNCFYFGNHWINALNIRYTGKQQMKQIWKLNLNPVKFKKNMAVVREENKIMECFFSVCEVLRKYDVILDSDSVTIQGKSTTTCSEFYGYDKKNDC
ncbi:MAG: hypothetical protein K2G25_07225 [Oscillospiraceae bacterium]|nr:hypothetical protein [Oscillospiraceae bacterium]